MIATRTAAVAGTYYPADTSALQHQLDELLAEAACDTVLSPGVYRPKALIVPHAGYRYSGPIAAAAYRYLLPLSGEISRVVVIGPCHRIILQGLAAPTATTFQTPLGDVPVDRQNIDRLVKRSLVALDDDAHQFEHSIEVQLPFLQRILHKFIVLPLVVGNNTPREQITDVLKRLWGSGETLIVISTDLSHYHPHQEAQRLDKFTSAMIEGFVSHLTSEQACGSRAVNGLLKLAEEAHLKLQTLDVRNSGDTAGDRNCVVGYGAYVIY